MGKTVLHLGAPKSQRAGSLVPGDTLEPQLNSNTVNTLLPAITGLLLLALRAMHNNLYLYTTSTVVDRRDLGCVSLGTYDGDACGASRRKTSSALTRC